MPLSDSILSYEDVRAVLDRALDSAHGIRITLPTKGKAIHMRHRLYKFRALDRRESTKIYPPSDVRYGVSVYDSLVAEVVDTSVLIRKTDVEALLAHVEDL